MGLSRNKVAVPEGVAGTPPFWSTVAISVTRLTNWFLLFYIILRVTSGELLAESFKLEAPNSPVPACRQAGLSTERFIYDNKTIVLSVLGSELGQKKTVP